MAERRIDRRTSEFGSIYKGREGQWSWIAHRITGVAIILFLFAHVVDTALVGWGPDAYNRVVRVYHNPFIRLLELGLVAVVLTMAVTTSSRTVAPDAPRPGARVGRVKPPGKGLEFWSWVFMRISGLV